MQNSLSWRILVDGDPHEPSLESEHGLSIWIEVNEHRILFDCGQTDMLTRNAGRLGVPLETVTTVVLSHGHYDHTGGFEALDGILPPNTLISAHPDVLRERFSRHVDGTVHAIGMPAASRVVIEKRCAHIRWVTEAHEIVPFVWVTGPIPRISDFEDTGGSFWLDSTCTIPDPIEDDLALWIVEKECVDVFCGCAHAGIANTIKAIHDTTGARPIRNLIGGLHLRSASAERLTQTVAFLQKCRIKKLSPCH